MLVMYDGYIARIKIGLDLGGFDIGNGNLTTLVLTTRSVPNLSITFFDAPGLTKAWRNSLYFHYANVSLMKH
jgi:hypothetical protein